MPSNEGFAAQKVKKKALPLPAGPPDLPVIRPSEQEFADLGRVLCTSENLGVQHGALKVVPPEGYAARSTYENFDTLIRCCASQTAEGDDGLYELTLEDAGSMYMSDVQRSFEESEAESEIKWSSDVRTAEIEFWRSVGLGDSSTVYTAQSINSSLFEKSARGWNFQELRKQRIQQKESGKGVVGSRASVKMSAQGVLGLGMGMAGTARGWSVSANGCYTIQYLHKGAPRTVYAVAPEHRTRFEELVSTLRAQVSDEEQTGSGEPDRGLQNASLLIDPTVLSKHKIGLFKTIQRVGEYIVHWPSSFFCTFSHGINIFEAVEWQPQPCSPTAHSAGDHAAPGELSAGKVGTKIKPEPTQGTCSNGCVNGEREQKDSHSNTSRAESQHSGASANGNANVQVRGADSIARGPTGLTKAQLTRNGGDISDRCSQKMLNGGADEEEEQLDGESHKRRRLLEEHEEDRRAGACTFPGLNGGLSGIHAGFPGLHPGMGMKMNGWSDGIAAMGLGLEGRGGPLGATNNLIGMQQHMALMQHMAALGHVPAHPPINWAAVGQPAMLMAMHGANLPAGPGRDPAQHDGADKNKNCHFCEHAPKRCAIFACLDPVCDQMFCENCCKRHLGRATGFKNQQDAIAANWRCPICTRQCCCTQPDCDRKHLHCKRYRRKMKHSARRGLAPDARVRDASFEDAGMAGMPAGGLMVKSDLAEPRKSLMQVKHGLDGAYRSDDDSEVWAQDHQHHQLPPARQRSREDSVGRLINGESGPEDSEDDHRSRVHRRVDARRGSLNAPGSSSSGSNGQSGIGNVNKLLRQNSEAEIARLMGSHAASQMRRTDSSTGSIHASGPLHINVNVSQGPFASNLHSALGYSGTPNSISSVYGAAVATPLHVGTPLTPLGDSHHQVGTPSGLADDQLELGSLAGTASCSWFDHLFGGGSGGGGNASHAESSHLHHHHPHHHQLAVHQHGQMHLGHGLVSGAGAVQKQTLQVTFPAGGLHKPLSNDKDESAPRLEDTTTSWAPDEFVFSPQGSDAEGGDEEPEDPHPSQQPANKKSA